MISINTAAYLGGTIGAVAGATFVRFVHLFAEEFGRAITDAFSPDIPKAPKTSSSIYKSFYRRDFWIITSIGAGSGALLGASLYQISFYALNFFK